MNVYLDTSVLLGTLDAIHLASALILIEENEKLEITFLTHDSQLSTAAISMGLTVAGNHEK